MSRICIFNAGFKGLAFAKDLLRNNHEVFLYDYRDAMIGDGLCNLKSHSFKFNYIHAGFDTIYPNPVKNPEAFQQFVLRHVQYLRPDIIFPVNSEEITALFPILEELRRFTKVPIGAWLTYNMLRNKRDFVREFSQFSPRTINIPKGVYYQKPLLGHSGDGVKRIEVSDHVLQREVLGTGVGFEAFMNNGKIVAYFMHRRIREFPISGGSSTARVAYHDPLLAKLSYRILKFVNWTGFIMLEFKQDDCGKYSLIEINPRPWGSIQLAIDHGVRFPTIAHDLFVKKDIQTRQCYPNSNRLTETRNVPIDILAGVCHLFRGDFHQFIDSISLWKSFNWEAFNWKQPKVCILYGYMLIKKLLLPSVNRLRL